MGNLLNSLATVAESMRATQLAIELAGNNVSNAKTPNFAKQRLDLEARRFEVNRGLAGGVRAGSLISSRQDYLEQAVQEQSNRLGRFSQQTSDLEQLEAIFDVSAGSGLGSSIDRLFESFSALSVRPNDTPAREAVLGRARDLAQGFRLTASTLGSANSNARNGLGATVAEINDIGAQIQKYNLQIRSDARNLQDPGLEAGIYGQLEKLSELVDFDTIRAEDGTLTVSLGGQTPLAVGASYFPIRADVSPTGGGAILRNAQGGEITGQIQQGRLRGQLEQQNGFLPALSADLDRLASTIANSVNTVLGSGRDRDGNTPTKDLFSFDATRGAAATLAVNDLIPSELAAASADAPGGNGNALSLADLSRSRVIDDYAVGQFYGSLAGRVGRTLANSRSDEHSQTLLLAQARNLRATATEVSIDEEAANLVAFQRQFEANGELIRILNSLTETTINLIR